VAVAEQQPWYPLWREAIERVIATRAIRERARPDTVERQAAEADYQAALKAYRSVVTTQIR
jgi:hypothetical protein